MKISVDFPDDMSKQEIEQRLQQTSIDPEVLKQKTESSNQINLRNSSLARTREMVYTLESDVELALEELRHKVSTETHEDSVKDAQGKIDSLSGEVSTSIRKLAYDLDTLTETNKKFSVELNDSYADLSRAIESSKEKTTEVDGRVDVVDTKLTTEFKHVRTIANKRAEEFRDNYKAIKKELKLIERAVKTTDITDLYVQFEELHKVINGIQKDQQYSSDKYAEIWQALHTIRGGGGGGASTHPEPVDDKLYGRRKTLTGGEYTTAQNLIVQHTPLVLYRADEKFYEADVDTGERIVYEAIDQAPNPPAPIGAFDPADILGGTSGNDYWRVAWGGTATEHPTRQTVLQVAHGFTQFQNVYKDITGVWQLAQANVEDTLKHGTISEIIDADNFEAVHYGLVISTAHGFTVGDEYYLDAATAGDSTNTKPIITGEYVQIAFDVLDADTIKVVDRNAFKIVEAIDGTTRTVKEEITQATHGFTTLQNVYKDNAGVWQLAQADIEATLKQGVVGTIIDADTFEVVYYGIIDAPAHGLIINDDYYLSTTVAGASTNVQPTTIDEYVQVSYEVIDVALIKVVDRNAFKIVEAIDGTTRTVKEEIAQTSHGFVTLQNVYKDTGGVWQLAQADSETTLKHGVVGEVADADNFEVVYYGIINSTGHSLTLGAEYYLDDTVGGNNVLVQTTTIGNYVQGTFDVLDADTVKVVDRNAFEIVTATTALMNGWFDPTQNNGGTATTYAIVDGGADIEDGHYVIATANGAYNFATGLPDNTQPEIIEGARVVYNGGTWAQAENATLLQGWFDPAIAGGGDGVISAVVDNSPDFANYHYVIALSAGQYDFATGTPVGAGGTTVSQGDRFVYFGNAWLQMGVPVSQNRGWFDPQVAGGNNGGIPADVINPDVTGTYQEGDYVVASASGWYDVTTGAPSAVGVGFEISTGDRLVYDATNAWQHLPASDSGLMKGWFNPTIDGGGVAVPFPIDATAGNYNTNEYIIANEFGRYDFALGVSDPTGTTVNAGDVFVWDGAAWRFFKDDVDAYRGSFNPNNDGGLLQWNLLNGSADYREGDFVIAIESGLYNLTTGLSGSGTYIRKGDIYRFDGNWTKQNEDSGLLYHIQYQVGHGFSQYDNVFFNSGTGLWQIADETIEAELPDGFIIEVPDADTIIVGDVGLVEDPAHGFAFGNWYLNGGVNSQTKPTIGFVQWTIKVVDANRYILPSRVAFEI